MGFFKKFLSLGSRRSKKRRAALSYETRPNPPLSREDARRQQEEQEEIANRLLRSSSLRYAVVNEVDYSSLPPIPHPVNSLSQMPGVPPSRSASVQTRRTYTVTIRDRKVEALTEFPNANPPLDMPTHPSHNVDGQSSEASKLQPVTPKDRKRLRMLGQDPSVASLLDMYDNKGHLNNNVFSNTPSATEKESRKDGRPQLKRGGSTLRQLLGNPESIDRTGSTEGDISWAEGFLRERGLDDNQSTSSASSFHLETPKDVFPDGGIFCENEPSTAVSDGSKPYSVDLNAHTAISSMTVEPSCSPDDNPTVVVRQATESELRPAAEVFGFLLEKRWSRRSISMDPELPLTVSSIPRDFNSSTSHTYNVPATPLGTRQLSSNSNDLRPVGASASADTPSTVGSILVDPPHTATILNHTRIPVVHGRLCEGSRVGQLTATAVTTRASRIPRGRHSLPVNTRALTPETYLPSTAATEPVKPSLTPSCRSDALRSAIHAVKRPSVVTPHVSVGQDSSFAQAPMRGAHRRSVSHGSSKPIPADWNMGLDATRTARVKGLKPNDGNKENFIGDVENASMHSSRNPKLRLPMTPSRERALLSSDPSPASSSELSPVGQKMMADLRKRRQARNDRRTNRFADTAIVYV